MTRLELWLRANGKTRASFAAEMKLSRQAIVRLATPSARQRGYSAMRFDVLLAVSDATGIMPGTLINDALGVPEPVFVEPVAAQ